MKPTENPATFLQPGRHVDSDHPRVIALAREVTEGLSDVRERAVALYYAVRDRFRYDPYALEMSERCFTASHVIEVGSGFCISKAALLAAAARAAGIPARLGFADVKNHLTSPKLMEMMGTDEFIYHGYTELWLEDRWYKATPAFNRSLCDKAGIQPLDFDGREDSIFHPLDLTGRRHMEYLRDRGSHRDVPVEELFAVWREAYPRINTWNRKTSGDFESEARAAEEPSRTAV